jgi:ankyrin repeat protein
MADADENYNDDFEDVAIDISRKSKTSHPGKEQKSNSVLSILKQSALEVDKEENEARKVLNLALSPSLPEKQAAYDDDHDEKKARNHQSHLESPPSHHHRHEPKKHDRYRIQDEEKKLEDDDLSNGNRSDGDDDEDDDLDPKLSLQVTQYLAAVNRGEIREVQHYIKDDEIPLTCRDRHGWTALHWAASSGHSDIITVVLESLQRKGKRLTKFVNCKEHITGWTALHIACVYCRVACVKALLSFGAKVDMKDNLDEYPVDCIGSKQQAEEVYDLVYIKDYLDAYTKSRQLTQEMKELT